MNQADRQCAKANMFCKDMLFQDVTIHAVNGTGLAV
jgi:hypothetical protein